MPSVEITQAQADLLARGKDITVFAPKPKPKAYIVTTVNGNVFKVTDSSGLDSRTSTIHGRCVLIGKGPHPHEFGHVQTGVYRVETCYEIDPEAVKL